MTEQSPAPSKSQHPGKSGKKALAGLKGRQPGSEALSFIVGLLGERSLNRDQLIEHLHLIQDTTGALSRDHLAALARHMRLSLAEVYEVASFYHNFHILEDGEEADTRPLVKVCESLTCACMGAEKLASELEQSGQYRVERAACMGRCDVAPVASVGKAYFHQATVEKLSTLATDAPGDDRSDQALSLTDYQDEGGYALYRDCLEGKTSAEKIIAALDEGELRGLGGAGFPTGLKWKLVRQTEGTTRMAVNGDESEPGTFKDRHYLETDPHRFLEGMLIGAWVVKAEEIYIYLRDEYPHLHQIIKEALGELSTSGLSLPLIRIRRGAGAYICGEESAMLESLEGKRGLPRHKPPYPSEVGLFGGPTLINNVETLYWIRDMVQKGAGCTHEEGRHGAKGRRSFSVSGRVKEPGVKLAPAGITVRELIEEYCGGMAEGHEFAAYLPGGASGGIFPAAKADIPLDFGTFEEHGGLIGSAAIIVLSRSDPIADVVRNLTHFFAHESCGQCTPCRLGTAQSLALMQEAEWDKDLLGELATVMADASICGLGQAAANPVFTALKYFRKDLP